MTVAPAQRIVSLLPSATEILFAVGAGARVVGVTHECDHPAAARSLPAVTANALPTEGAAPGDIDRHIRRARHQGSSIYLLDEDLLASLQPDLIVTQELCDVCAVAYTEVQQAARRLPGDVPVLSLEPSSLDDILVSVDVVGRATGCAKEAETLIGRLRRRLDAVAATPAPDPRPRVACIEWTDPLMAGGHWVPDMVRIAGGDDVLGRPGEPSREVSWEAIAELGPEVLLLMPCGFGLERTLEVSGEVTGRPGFDLLPCAASGRTVALDGSGYFNRPGPRIVDGVELMAAAFRANPGARLPEGAAWVSVPLSTGSSGSGYRPAP